MFMSINMDQPLFLRELARVNRNQWSKPPKPLERSSKTFTRAGGLRRMHPAIFTRDGTSVQIAAAYSSRPRTKLLPGQSADDGCRSSSMRRISVIGTSDPLKTTVPALMFTEGPTFTIFVRRLMLRAASLGGSHDHIDV